MIALTIARLPQAWRWTGQAACIALLISLGIMSRRQIRIYHDPITLYDATLELNPGCWMAQNNLATLANADGHSAESISRAHQALALRENYPEAHCNLGIGLLRTGNRPAAIAEFETALRLQPDYVDAHNNLGIALASTGNNAAAIEHFIAALQHSPGNLKIYRNLASLYIEMNDPRRAIAVLQMGIEATKVLGDTQGEKEITRWLAEYRATLSEQPREDSSFNLGGIP